MRIPSEDGRYLDRTMLFAAFLALYACCATLLLAVVVQDRRRSAERGSPPDLRATHGTEFVFRTQA